MLAACATIFALESRSLVSLRSSLRLLELLPIVLLVRARFPDRVERVELLLLCRDGARRDLLALPLDGDDLLEGILGHVLQLVAWSVSLLHAALSRALGEDEKLRLVLQQARHIPLQALDAAVLTAVVHRDADGRGELHRDLGLAQLSKGEAAAQSQLHVVARRGRAHGGPKLARRRPGRKLRRLRFAILRPALLPASLVKPGTAAQEGAIVAAREHAIDLPEVHVRDHMVAGTRHGRLRSHDACTASELPSLC